MSRRQSCAGKHAAPGCEAVKRRAGLGCGQGREYEDDGARSRVQCSARRRGRQYCARRSATEHGLAQAAGDHAGHSRQHVARAERRTDSRPEVPCGANQRAPTSLRHGVPARWPDPGHRARRPNAHHLRQHRRSTAGVRRPAGPQSQPARHERHRAPPEVPGERVGLLHLLQAACDGDRRGHRHREV